MDYTPKKLTKIQTLACLGVTDAIRTTDPYVRTGGATRATGSYNLDKERGHGGLWVEKGINIGYTRIVQLVEKEVPLSTYRVTEAEDQIRPNNKGSLTTKDKWRVDK